MAGYNEDARGVCDNAQNWAQLLKTVIVCKRLYLPVLNRRPFIKDARGNLNFNDVRTGAALRCLLRVSYQGTGSTNYDPDILFVGELWAYGVEPARFVADEEAASKYEFGLLRHFYLPNVGPRHTGVNGNDYLALIGPGGSLHNLAGELPPTFPCDFTQLVYDYTENRSRALTAASIEFCNNAKSAVIELPFRAVCNYVVSIAKRGHLSSRQLIKINAGIFADVGVDPGLDQDMISCMWREFRGAISADVAANLFTAWYKDIPYQEFRLALLFNQTAGSGLTTYIMIRDALTNFPDFVWSDLYNLIPTEFTTFRTAHMEVVNAGNSGLYLGFNNNIGNLKATGYRNLGAVAIKLNMELGEMGTMRNYAGGSKTLVPRLHAVEDWITAYVNHKRNRQAQPGADHIMDVVEIMGRLNIPNPPAQYQP